MAVTVESRKPYFNFLKERRVAAGLSQAELAERVGVTFTTVSRYETGDRGMDRHITAIIAEVLGCEPHELYTTPHSEG